MCRKFLKNIIKGGSNMHTLDHNIYVLYIDLKSYKLLVEEYLQYANYKTAKMVDFIQWVKLAKAKKPDQV